MTVTGNVKSIGETQTFGSNGFRKRELVVTTEEQYPQPIMIEFVQDKCDLLNQFGEGQNVTVSINLRGREWVNPRGETKYFNSIQGWKIEGEGTPSQKHIEKQAADPKAKTPPAPKEDEDDLPF